MVVGRIPALLISPRICSWNGCLVYPFTPSGHIDKKCDLFFQLKLVFEQKICSIIQSIISRLNRYCIVALLCTPLSNLPASRGRGKALKPVETRLLSIQQQDSTKTTGKGALQRGGCERPPVNEGGKVDKGLASVKNSQ